MTGPPEEFGSSAYCKSQCQDPSAQVALKHACSNAVVGAATDKDLADPAGMTHSLFVQLPSAPQRNDRSKHLVSKEASFLTSSVVPNSSPDGWIMPADLASHCSVLLGSLIDHNIKLHINCLRIPHEPDLAVPLQFAVDWHEVIRLGSCTHLTCLVKAFWQPVGLAATDRETQSLSRPAAELVTASTHCKQR